MKDRGLQGVCRSAAARARVFPLSSICQQPRPNFSRPPEMKDCRSVLIIYLGEGKEGRGRGRRMADYRFLETQCARALCQVRLLQVSVPSVSIIINQVKGVTKPRANVWAVDFPSCCGGRVRDRRLARLGKARKIET